MRMSFAGRSYCLATTFLDVVFLALLLDAALPVADCLATGFLAEGFAGVAFFAGFSSTDSAGASSL